MKWLVYLIFFLFFSIDNYGQTIISGSVTDKENNAITGANVYLEGTYDGSSTDSSGSFTFTTSESGSRALIVSMMGYETHMEVADVTFLSNQKIILNESVNSLTGVTLTAGTFEAVSNSKASVLKPLDIVTTAGALGDVVASIQTLPGTTTVNEDGRLFVRGGEADETQVFIDGLRVFQPFNASANNIPTRGRFSPFLFKGITFSTGGYSAEYGQALSGVLLLNTIDEPVQEKTDISIMTVGLGLGHTEIWGDQSLSINTSYINLAPYETLIPSDQGVRWNSPYESFSGETVFRSKKDKSLFKLYAGFTYADFDIEQENINFEEYVPYQQKNNNFYLNASYKHFLANEWSFNTGASISYDGNVIGLFQDKICTNQTAAHLKFKVRKGFSNRFNLNFGIEHFITDYSDLFRPLAGLEIKNYYNDNLSAIFIEGDIFLNNRFAVKLGARAEYSNTLNELNFAPRVSLAYKSGDHGQFSLAYGDFYQNPQIDYLKYNQELKMARTSHYILNYQYLSDGKTFRAEAYYKDYQNLIKYNTEFPQFDSDYNNQGSGTASGLDIFWRDNKSLKNLDYWLSYSYLSTERDYLNFPQRATPNFAPNHSFSAVTKYWVDKLRSQVGLSYTFGSGRPYNDPNSADFLAEKTSSYNNLSFNWAYLIDQQKILYFSVSNVLSFNNISNYEYANSPNSNGIFERLAIRPPADTFFFVGFFWTISTDKKSNQLNNL
ncbi:MAG: TonB-dependent receptor [Eudoraea sp.]|uniref:TonB-dependent receptor n=1 Tax=Eudoraea sp. TaxID=1979955 RepID=UPI003C72FBB3